MLTFEETFNNILERCSTKEKGYISNSNITLLEDAITFIKQNYKKTITLDDLSRYCCVSKQHLNRCFNNNLNITPMAFVIQYKIFMACSMFKESIHSIKEVSCELGFDNQCYFSKVFKRITGITPSDYKLKFNK